MSSAHASYALRGESAARADASQAASGADDFTIVLRPQQRLDRALQSRCGLIAVQSGMLALECTPTRDRRQILEFLLNNDVIDAPLVVHSPNVSLRAITRATLTAKLRTGISSELCARSAADLATQSQQQLARAHLHNLMIGHLDAEARVASLMLTLALRFVDGRNADGMDVPLPMSRDDIADHLAINRDTLSRVMMRLETHGVIARLNRHAVRVINPEAIRALTPIAALVDKVYGSDAPAAGAA